MAAEKSPPTTKPKPPNMDVLFDRIQEKNTKATRTALVKMLRAERERWHEKQEEKRDKKER